MSVNIPEPDDRAPLNDETRLSPQQEAEVAAFAAELNGMDLVWHTLPNTEDPREIYDFTLVLPTLGVLVDLSDLQAITVDEFGFSDITLSSGRILTVPLAPQVLFSIISQITERYTLAN